MKTKLLIIILFLSIKSFSQDEKQIGKRNEVKINYQTILKNEGKKKDSYILIVNAENTNKENLYYAVNLTKNNEGKWVLPYTPAEKGFTKIKVRNSTGWFGDGQSLTGDLTDYFTTDNKVLYEIKKSEVYTKETSFKVKKGKKPLITNSFSKSLMELSKFDIRISSKMLDGDYISSCGNIKINVSSGNTTEKGDFIIQTTNGKQFYWIRKSDKTFVRGNNSEYTLSYNKSNATFTYSTSDGINCIWEKK